MKKTAKQKNEEQLEEQPFEKEILKNVYKYEAKRTYKMILYLWLGFIFVQFFIVITAGALYETLKEQQTLDLFQLFGENFDTITENFMDVLDTFYTESPHLLLISFLVLLLTIFGIIFFVAKNFKRIKNRIASINKFFSKK